MAVLENRPDGDDFENGALFEEDGIEQVEEDEYDSSEVPEHLLPLLTGAQSGDVNQLREALDNFVGDINEPIEDGDTLLHLTCLHGQLASVQLLLERGGVNLEAEDADGGIPLHDACAGGHFEIAKELINHANDPERVTRMLETVDSDGDTPLHNAARGEHPNIINLLLAHGASLTAKNAERKTPAELADPGTDARAILEAASA